eukprot:1154875-Pelagomonas_calceolata.AAC.6
MLPSRENQSHQTILRPSIHSMFIMATLVHFGQDEPWSRHSSINNSSAVGLGVTPSLCMFQ